MSVDFLEFLYFRYFSGIKIGALMIIYIVLKMAIKTGQKCNFGRFESHS